VRPPQRHSSAGWLRYRSWPLRGGRCVLLFVHYSRLSELRLPNPGQ
jgi:hypothetical protein